MAVKEVAKDRKEGFNSLAILVAWEIRKHMNYCLFNDSNPNIKVVLRALTYECILWCLAKAKGLQELLARSVGRVSGP